MEVEPKTKDVRIHSYGYTFIGRCWGKLSVLLNIRKPTFLAHALRLYFKESNSTKNQLKSPATRRLQQRYFLDHHLYFYSDIA